MSFPIRVLLVDDHPLIRAGVHSVLEEEKDITVVGETDTSEGLERLCEALQPDVVLLDLRIPGPPLNETVARLRSLSSPPHIILLSAYDDEIYIKLAVGTNISGYILKDEMPETVVKAIRTVVNGGTWYSETITRKISRLISSSHALNPDLTPRELDVLDLLAQGYSNEQISKELGLAYQTVRNYVSRIYSKLGVHSRTEAAQWAQQFQAIRARQNNRE